MRHPFDGIILAPAADDELSARDRSREDAERSALPAPPRRTFLRALATLVLGGGASLVSPRSSLAQRMTTQALSEEGGFSPPRHDGYRPGQGGEPPGWHRGWSATTQALGEEGGPRGRSRWGGRVTTHALGEEGGRRRRGHGLATTEAFGEEGAGGGYPRFDVYR